MPTVPSYGGQQAAPSSLPGGGFAAAPVANAEPQQLQQLGDATTRAANTGANIVSDIQMMANQVPVDVSVNALRQFKQDRTFNPEDGFLSKKGLAAVQPDPLGRPMPQQYGEEMQDKINELAGKLSNDAQRRVFLEQAHQIATQFNGEVQSHMLQEHRAVGLEAQDGNLRLASDEAKRHWDDPKAVAQSIQDAQRSVWKAGQLNGEPGNLTEAKMKDATSAIHSGVIAAAIQKENFTYAQQYLSLNKGGMTADDILRVSGLVNHGVDGSVSMGAVEAAKKALGNQFAPSDMDRLTSIVQGMESQGRETNADGSVLTSPKGAKGSMQVLDSTNTNPGFGVTPAKDGSPAERARVGRDYLAAMVKQYGNPAQAMAAYNAGPGKLDEALAAAKKAGTPDQWLALMPKETQAYVQSGMSKLQTGGGAPPFPTESAFVQAALDKLGPNPRVEQVRLTREQAAAQYTMLDKSRKEQGEQAVAAAQQALVSNGGNFAALSPEIKAAVSRWAPDRYAVLQDYAGKIADPIRSDNLSAYNQAIQHPDEMAKMPDTKFEDFIKQNFTQRTARALAKERQDQLDGTNDASAQGINRPAVNRALNNAMLSLGIPISASKGQAFGMAEQQRLGGIRAYVDQSIFAAQKETGQKMTAEQVQQHISKLFATDVTFKNTLWYGSAGPDTAQKLMSMTLADLPAGAADGLRKALVTGGNRAPTDTDVLNLYRRMHAPQ